MNTDDVIGVLGATSHVGLALLSLLETQRLKVFAFSRQVDQPDFKPITDAHLTTSCAWKPAESIDSLCQLQRIPYWISLAPIRVLPDYFSAIEQSGAQRIVVLSSTSRFTKHYSSDPADQALAQSFIDLEATVQSWAESKGIECVILRPTLIYGLGKDKNICEIIRLIRRFGFFPLFGESRGLRQPVHCQDVAQACIAALQSAGAANRSYNLSGAERLSYRTMVERIFAALQRKPRFFHVPMPLFQVAVTLLRLFPRYRNWSFSMVERMNQDMVFEHLEAARDLQFTPRAFELTPEDLP